MGGNKKTDWCLVGNGMGLLLIVIMDHSRKFPAFSTGTNTWDTIDTTLFMWKLQISGLLGHTLLSRPAGSRVQEQMNFKSLGKTILSQMISQGQTTFLSSIYFLYIYIYIELYRYTVHIYIYMCYLSEISFRSSNHILFPLWPNIMAAPQWLASGAGKVGVLVTRARCLKMWHM